MPMSPRLALLDTLIAKGSVDPFVHYARAMELRAQGSQDDALAAFGQLRERFPAYVPTYLMGGQLAAELGRTEVARTFLDAGLAAARTAGDAHTESELVTALAALPHEAR